MVRAVGREVQVPVADCFAAFAAVRAADPRHWELRMSDTIHPNLLGHQWLAEEVAGVISGQRHRGMDLPVLPPALPRVLARLRAHQPVRVVAMKPYDAWIGGAMQAAFPAAQVTIRSWDAGGQSLAELAREAQAFGRFETGGNGSPAPVDLVVLAVPAAATAPDEDHYCREYSELANAVLPFAPGGWDCVAALPSMVAAHPDAAHAAREDLARQVLRGKDMAGLERPAGDATPAAELLACHLRRLLEEPGS
jgi:hypothetical protein